MERLSIRDISTTALFSAILAVSAWISSPSPIPFTLQILVFYLALFGFGGGVGYILGASGGYILAMPFAAALYALLEKLFSRGKKRRLVYAFLTLALIYAMGSLWFAFVYSGAEGFFAALAVTALPYIIPDILKIFLAYYITKRLSPFFIERGN